MNIIKRFRLLTIQFLNRLKLSFDIRFFLFVGGLGLFGYGLYLYSPSLSFTITGFIIMFLGLTMRDNTKP